MNLGNGGTDVAITQLQRAPSFFRTYAVALFGGRTRPVLGGVLPLAPAIGVSLAPQPFEPERFARFCDLCSVADRTWLPITWPQVLAGALHGALLSDARVPFPLLGLVHVSNSITQFRPLFPSEPLALLAKFGDTRAVKRGVEFDLHTEARVGAELVWRSTLSALVPGTGPKKAQRAPRPDALSRPAAPVASEAAAGRLRSVSIDVKANTGRRYSSMAGDYNPIHLWALTAKAFGFPRAIVHGMWSLSRVAAELAAETTAQGGPWRLSARFKKPLFLPSTVLLSSGPCEGGQDFSMTSTPRGDALLAGSLVRLL